MAGSKLGSHHYVCCNTALAVDASCSSFVNFDAESSFYQLVTYSIKPHFPKEQKFSAQR